MIEDGGALVRARSAILFVLGEPRDAAVFSSRIVAEGGARLT